MTAPLQEQLDKAVAAVPPAHRLDPSRDEVFESKKLHFQGFKIGLMHLFAGWQISTLYGKCLFLVELCITKNGVCDR